MTSGLHSETQKTPSNALTQYEFYPLGSLIIAIVLHTPKPCCHVSSQSIARVPAAPMCAHVEVGDGVKLSAELLTVDRVLSS